MKQHITHEQYNEVKEVRRKLEDLGLFKAANVDIGKMIEVLYEFDCDIHIELEETIWHVCLGSVHEYSEELADAPWEAVKEGVIDGICN